MNGKDKILRALSYILDVVGGMIIVAIVVAWIWLIGSGIYKLIQVIS